MDIMLKMEIFKISEEKNHAFELVATALDQVTEYGKLGQGTIICAYIFHHLKKKKKSFELLH
jgi:hypothetical protein